MKTDVKQQTEKMNKLLCRLLWSQLQSMGLFNGTEIFIDDLKTKSGIKALYGKWLEETLAVLTRNNFLRNNGSSYIITNPAPTDLEIQWQEWERQIVSLREDPIFKAQIKLAEATLRVLPEILTGKILATDIIFPNSSMELIAGIYKNNAVADYFNEVLANTVCAYIQERLTEDPSARIRLIEIGAGTGGTSTMVFRKIRPYREHIQEYCYTDISKAFLMHAEKEYGPENPYLTYYVFNVEIPVFGQGVSAGGYDIAIAANVLHATKNIRQTLENAKVLLKKNGLLLLNEISQNLLFTHLTFGLLEGWWLYEDPGLRISGCPGLPPENWQKVLEGEGFRSIFFPAEAVHDLGQQIIVAESDGIVRQKQPWVSSRRRAFECPLSETREPENHLVYNKPVVTQKAANLADQTVTDHVRKTIMEKLSESLKVDINQIDGDESFADYGVDSITGVNLVQIINQALKIELETISLFEYTSVNQLAAHILSLYQEPLATAFEPARAQDVTGKTTESFSTKRSRFQFSKTPAPSALKPEAALERIAVIGISGVFPQAGNVEEFWENIREGKECITEIPQERWDWREYYGDPAKKANKTNIKWGGFIEGVTEFDPLFFGISPLEAQFMDPQQRLFLENCWHCFEDAGLRPSSLSGSRCGVYVGCGGSSYRSLLGSQGLNTESLLGNASSILAARISYFLNLKGSSLAIDTACSSAMVAITEACNGLCLLTCDLALAGGVSVSLSPDMYITSGNAGMLSPDGRCFAFDDRANGFIPGEGVGVVLLKRLSDAVRDRDPIHGVICGWGTNQDGKTNGITAPSMNSQMVLEKEVYERFGINPESISLVEAHGAATALGDPIEVEALTRAFQSFTDKKRYCALGTVKSNIGHVLHASGAAGIIKVLMAMRYRQLPPAINYEIPNKHISLDNSPFYINTTLRHWESESGFPRRAAVSSFGFSGTNAHIVIEEYLPQKGTAGISIAVNPDIPIVFVLSAKSQEQLKIYAEQLKRFIESQIGPDLTDMAYTLQVGREPMEHRLAFLADSRDSLLKTLTGFISGNPGPEVLTGEAGKGRGPVGVPKTDEDLKSWVEKGKWQQIAEFWVNGSNGDWDKLYGDRKPRRINIPGYPFAKESYWISERYWAPVRANNYSSLQNLHRLWLKRYSPEKPPVEPEPLSSPETLLLQFGWREEPIPVATTAPEYIQHLVILCEMSGVSASKELSESLENGLKGVRCLILHSKRKGIDQRFQTYVVRVFEEIQSFFKDQSAGKVLVQIVVPNQGEKHLCSGLAGLLKTARSENPQFTGQLIEADPGENLAGIIAKLEESARIDASRLLHEIQIRYQDGKRWVGEWKELKTAPEAGAIPWKDGGVYLITGGAGGLGLIFAGEIVRQVKNATVILTGRSVLNEQKQAKIKELEDACRVARPCDSTGARIIYRQVDVSDRVAVEGLIQNIKEECSSLQGIIHCAGVIRDNYIVKKTEAEILEVLAPKVSGLINLDQATQGMKLDFMILFSSISGSLGNAGQADYAAANAFMDAYVGYRNDLVTAGERYGRTVAINWPFWKEGGMGIDPESGKMLLQTLGLTALNTLTGIRALYQCLISGKDQVMVLEGERQKLQTTFLSKPTGLATSIAGSGGAHKGRGRRPEMKGLSLEQCLEWDLKEIINKILRIPRDKIDRDKALAEFGFNSLSLNQLAIQLIKHFGISITPALFFGYSTVEKLTRYYITEFYETIREFYREGDSAPDSPKTAPVTPRAPEPKRPGRLRFFTREESLKVPEPIAIIGMSGRFPGARNIDELWEILAAGQDMVREIPPERFDWRQYYGDPSKEPGKTNGKWCGCIPGVGEFDPLFFEISPREAETMDPRQRLLLMESWKALEDAGFGPTQIKAETIGMFVGVEEGEYRSLIRGEGGLSSNNNAILAARLAYFLNLNGPVLAIDTACSSGLVAAHQAVLSLRAGECSAAIAAGVTLLLTPEPFIEMGQAGMLSDDGKCHTFDKRADGMVPGEAVAAIVLKRLSKAKADGDPIYAVIKGNGINYDGKTNGITAPSGVSQIALLKSVYNQFQVNPEEIEYIVTHGTGTKLGDPIEINALYDAFKEYTSKQGYCALTSTKTNFGHSLGASGLVSLISLVQAIRHETFPASLHCEQENDYINWQESPFFVNKTKKPWPAKDRRMGADCKTGAVSSFGMSGTNAHIVVQSYSREDNPEFPEAFPGYLLAFSAKTQEALEEKVQDMLAVLENKSFIEQGLARISYTLLEGRHHFNYRLAMVVQDREHAIYMLKQVLDKEKTPHVFQGKVPRDFTGQKAIGQYGQELLKESWNWREDHPKYQETLFALADLYCQGYQLDWGQLFGAAKPERIHLPTYPFARDHYWAPVETHGRASLQAPPPEPATGMLMFEPVWREQTIVSIDMEAKAPEYSEHLVILVEPESLERAQITLESIESKLNMVGLAHVRVISLQAKQQSIAQRYQEYAARIFEEFQKLFADKRVGKVLLQLVVTNLTEQKVFAGLAGLLKTAQLENPKVIGQIIEIEANEGLEGLIAKLKESARQPMDSQIRYLEGKRLVAGWSEVTVTPETIEIPWKVGGVYLITGGLGGLGMIFAKEIAERVKEVTLVLTGRSPLGEAKQLELQKLESTGIRVEYRAVDVNDRNAVNELIGSIQAELGRLDGIIHAAGVIRDNYLLKKTKEEVMETLAPKVTGLVNLDVASSDLDLDFMILFSSVAGRLGNPGQADYAAANGFMDAYAGYRNALVSSGLRKGRTLSINWPLWQEGGMRVDETVEKMMRQTTGMAALRTGAGIRALYQAFATSKDQLMVCEGELSKIREWLQINPLEIQTKAEQAPVDAVDAEKLKEKTLFQLKALFGEITKLSSAKIDIHEPLESYGIDSMMITQLNQKLADNFRELSKTIFYEYQTLDALAKYLIAEHSQECIKWTGLGQQMQTPLKVFPKTIQFNDEFPVLISGKSDEQPTLSLKGSDFNFSRENREPIAIIGLSGRYPQARNLEAFWENLVTGKDCITEIPEERWPLEGFYHPDPDEAVTYGKSYSKWGGFLEGFADFDPLFFNIAPREALNMDPQERLFIEVCWEVLEDAGYTREQVAEQYHGRVGVFAGITKTGFDLYGPDLWRQGEAIFPHTSFGSVANRVSYLLNLQGPSMPIDTMCSSSLTAIHEACEYLWRGECEMAIAGGVNLYLHPSSYIGLCGQRMLSYDGQCKSFGKDGNGFVPGEGVGAVLLKPLSRAITDQDHIYAVIRGTSINHGGKTNGYTVPNPKAQGELIRTVLEQSGVNARAVSFIEAHGTGTELGDPIEVAGLTQAFRKDTEDKGFCAIGSVKSNIGHLEAAAGIAGLTKIVLQMKRQKIVPSLHAEELNPNINFINTAFIVQQTLTEWEQPVVTVNGETKGYPRIAGISSFGAGGSNAHIIIEEYIPNNQEQPAITRADARVTPQHPAIIILSAKNEERLKEQAERLMVAIRQQELTDANLANIAYTLQVGREAMEERLGIITGSIEELIGKLAAFIAGQVNIEDLYRGQVKRNQEALTVFTVDEDLHKAVESWVNKGKYGKLLDLWVKGMVFDWRKIYGENKPHRISLPTYPFAGERYWIPVGTRRGAYPRAGFIHPLLQKNTSDLSEQRYSSTFTGKEFFLADHIVKGQKVLPEVAYLEMARAAVEAAWPADLTMASDWWTLKLKNVVWAQPIRVVDEPVQIHIGLYPGENDEISYEIYSLSENGSEEASRARTVYSQGNATMAEVTENPVLDLKALQAECNERKLSGIEIYSIFKTIGLAYGPGHQGIETIYTGQGLVLAKLSIPSSVAETKEEFVLHPSIMDGALHAAIGMIESGATGDIAPKPFLPSALQELEVYCTQACCAHARRCTGTTWAVIQYSKDNSATDKVNKLDIDICDEQGNVCARLKGLEVQEDPEINPLNISISEHQEPYEMMAFEEVWQEQILPELSPVKLKPVICFLSNPEKQQEMMDALSTYGQETKLIFIGQNTNYQKQTSQNYSISRADRNTYEEAFQSIREDYGEVEAIFYLWALEDTSCIKDYSCPVYLLQAIAAANIRPKRVLLAASFANDSLERCYLESWIGFERSCGMILPDTQIAAIYYATGPDQGTTMKDWTRTLLAELQNPKLRSVLYQGGKRYKYQTRPITIPTGKSILKTGGTYLITGGCGGLGFLFAKYFAQKHPVNLVFTGRSAIDAGKQMKIKELETLGSQALYLQADVCNSKAMKTGLKAVRERFGKINGVIHAAGIASAQSILEKGVADFQKVINPKIIGTQRLDEALKEEPLDFICYFSSSAAILGDFGACDYAVGNRFQMAYAHYRNQQSSKGLIQGKTIVINWPLWKEGGMGFGNDENTKMYLKSSGQRILETAEGVGVFDRILGQNGVQYLIITGQPGRVHRFLGLTEERSTISLKNSSSSDQRRKVAMKGLSVEQRLEWDLKEQIGNLLKISRNQIERDKNLADFGFDSISLSELARLLTNLYGIEITPAIFFGYSTLEKLTQYFLHEHQETIQEFYREEDAQKVVPPEIPAPGQPRIKRSRFLTATTENSQESIAIIGMSGRFPGARNIDELWTILATGQNMVKEIPEERFDWRQYYGGPVNAPGKTNCKWCGCIPGVSEFDPLFFEISPREAETMDPRQRLLLEESWKALEDAGYGPGQIKTQKIGMFVGAEQGDYLALTKGEGSVTSNHNAILASRLAYFLNLNGPVMAIDTACSSGLVAAHQGILSLRNQECDTVIIAGVNLMLTPEPFIGMSQAGMLSGDGKCYAFDKRADGMVPGEAVAVIVCKRLSRAEADGDPIHAVIRGSGMNYDGKTNGITAPSGVSQTSLLKFVYDKYRINPEEIEYIVTHGTGTKLGDPVEVNALYDAFKTVRHVGTRCGASLQDAPKQGYCALTSTKTNLGHTFAASGLVSLISLVLAFRHETIPASINCEQENDYFKWKESPFYVNKTNKLWPGEKGRIGAVSAFGMSGTNVHMVLQSYARVEAGSKEEAPYYLLAISAKTREALQEKKKDLIKILENVTSGDLSQISYTLLEGRHHFDYRYAAVVQDREEAIHVFKQMESKEKIPGLFQGMVPRDFTGQKAIAQYAQELLKQSQTSKENKSKYQEILFALADLYCQGYELEWNILFSENKPRRVNLPTYPFAKERYWSSVESHGRATLQATIHPLLHQNTSDLTEQRYSSTFTGREFFLADHVVRGQKVLPGVAYLEMARAAIEEAAGSPTEKLGTIKLKNVVWARPIGVDEEPVQVHIGLYPEDCAFREGSAFRQGDGEIAYEIYSLSDADEAGASRARTIYSQGSAIVAENSKNPVLNLQALQEECNERKLFGAEIYSIFKAIGLEYGPGFQGVETVFTGHGRVLAKLSLPPSVAGTGEEFILHPSIMDAALQASIGMEAGETEAPKLFLPYALNELEVYCAYAHGARTHYARRCTGSMWAILQYSKDNTATDKIRKLDIDICDEQGQVCIRLKGFSSRILEGGIDETGPVAAIGSLMFEPVWKEQTVTNTNELAKAPEFAQQLVILCEPGPRERAPITPESIENGMNGIRCVSLKSNQKNIDKRFKEYAVQVFEEIQKILLAKPAGQILVQLVIASPSEMTSPAEMTSLSELNGQAEQKVFAGLSGLLKTAQLENPKVMGQIIEIEAAEELEGLIVKLKESARFGAHHNMDNQVRYQGGKRLVAGWREITVSPEALETPWKDGGVYLITGGTGGLGMIFAKEIVGRVKRATLVLTGRSMPGEAKHLELKKLESPGIRVEYRQMDVTDRQAVKELIRSIGEEFGKLDGIIHSAGVIRDNYLIKKTREELLEVLNPKVTGVVNLDEASKDLSLDFMIFFSSISGSLGNPGQADYAAANAFMDAYAGYRNGLVSGGERQGRTISINWPLWQEGGMRVDETVEKMMQQSAGMVALRTGTGIRALYHGIASGRTQVGVLEGDIRQIRAMFSKQPMNSGARQLKQESGKVANQDLLREKVSNYLKKVLSPVIKLSAERVEADIPLEKYGIDSIMAMELTNQLEKAFGSLSKTLFFEYQTIRELSGYFLESYREQLNRLIGIEKEEDVTKYTDSPIPSGPIMPVIHSGITARPRRSRFTALQPIQESKSNGPLDIAIIGVSGRYPQARNLDEFWKNLRDGKDCITEIPKDRWDHNQYYDEDKNKPGKTYSKWGGFIEGVDQFDPLFFNISPMEAEIMDPQERLFLECVYETLEDAGYTRETLAPRQGSETERNIGVYVGVMYEEYQLYGAQEQVQGRTVALSGSPSSIANRVSYFCNFHGPSMALDTMCSASLTAIHLACQSIQRGACELAIAGGVNVSIHPNKYLMLAQGKFASSKGRCESFGEGGDGYVPGEGVGAVLLKPLARAIADGDRIYGVIKGTAVNHGGKTNGYSVPNPNAQAGVIRQALQEAGIDPRTISYIEAHGTGTSLGDPIEITGLIKAFQKYTENKQFCAIGSAKSNIGHCESAAGIAGVTKVLLQLKNRQIAPSLHSEVLNPNIDFLNTPFVVQQTLTQWKRPVVTIEGVTKEYPRIAGISSFGAGGSNAHIVIEEYIPGNQEQAQVRVSPRNPAAPGRAIIVLSAKNEVRLKEQVERLLTTIEDQRFTDTDLADIAFTLQVGREAMEERLGLVVSSIGQLAGKLTAFLTGEEGIEDLYRGQVKRNQDDLTLFTVDEDMQMAIESWIKKGKYGKLLNLWVKGLVFDFNRLYGENYAHGGAQPRRISLPTYPFAKEHYWFPEQIPERHQAPVIPVETHGRASLPKHSKTEKTILIKDWQSKEITNGLNILTGAIVVLGTAKTTKLALALFQDMEAVKVITVMHEETNKTSGITTDFYSASAGEALYRRIKEELNGVKLTGVIDLTAYDDDYEQSAALEAGKLIFLQKLIENDRHQGYCLMQVTYRLNNLGITKTTMQGARLAGLYRMLGTEYQQIKTLTMDTDYPLNFYKKTAKQIQTEFLNRQQGDYSECCYRNDIRYEPILRTSRTEAEIQAENGIPARYRPEEVVLITGGSRGIGAAVAGHIVSQGVKNLVIIGREELPQQSEWETVVVKQENLKLTEKLKRLQSYIERGVNVRYYNTSLSNETGIRAIVEKTHQELGPITGVFHCAGLVSKTPVFFEKTLSEIEAVYEPKMSGLTTLHRALTEEPLSFFLLFSSISGIAPTLAVGQSDYAAANAYMDYYAINQAGQGKTYLKSVQWPAWGETGMAAGEINTGGINTPAYLSSGLVSHSTADGLMLLDIIKQGTNTVSIPCVMAADKFNPNQLLQTKLAPLKKESRADAGLIVNQGPALKTTGKDLKLHSIILEWLREIFVSKLKLGNVQWDSNKTFDEYGVDSIILAQLVATMQERITQPLDPSLLLQFRTLEELAEYFVTHHGEAFSEIDEFQREMRARTREATELDVDTENDITLDQSYERAGMGLGLEYPAIAIIGIACRFPGSPDKEAYWDLLTQGMTAIKPVPAKRWSPPEDRRDYGGWLDEIDLFDAKFFNINEKDALTMDPQTRVILEESLKAVYDAGYEHQQLSGKKIGVYIGGRLQTNLSIETILQAPNPILGMGQNYMATNISRFFNFTGPSMVVDTACSSGLTGMSLAAEALQGRRIEMALAGAVNLLNPTAFDLFAARNILSKNGEFRIFEEQSQGEVLGEGAGVVILKRLDDAIRDGNRIYGVIKAIAVNNDGRTIGPGSPNLDAQKQVIKEALALSGKSIAEIGYIEVNGGGSPVVDAVEIKSLAETYCLDDQTVGPCFVGSIKPNIGHLLLTSGMAELIRCVLSVYHKRIPPFLSAIEPFPYYDFSNSRIRFNRETIDWEVSTGRKRVAALNSFPDGGTNCHLIIEEFTPEIPSYQPLFTPLELPAMDRKVLKIERQIAQAGKELIKQESSPNVQLQPQRKLENLLSGFKIEPPEPKAEKPEVLMIKWGE